MQSVDSVDRLGKQEKLQKICAIEIRTLTEQAIGCKSCFASRSLSTLCSEKGGCKSSFAPPDRAHLIKTEKHSVNDSKTTSSSAKY